MRAGSIGGRQSARLLAVALVASAAVALPAVSGLADARAASAAGTIVFIKSYNVWLVRPDGTGQYQVTRDGTYALPYLSPSMSDAGVIAVGHGSEIVRMRQNGQVLNRIDPHPLPNSAGQPTDGPPVQVSISPDGKRIAYTMVNYGCPIGTSCLARAVTGVTDAAALTPNRIGANYYSHPSWVGDGRVMTHGGYGSHMMLQGLGGAPQHWFDDSELHEDGTDLGDGEISRDGRRLAVVRGYGADTHLMTAVVAGDPRTGAAGSLPDPAPRCFTNNDAAINSPSWGPDHRSLVLGDSDGLVVLGEGASCGASTFRAIAPGGSSPHWSPAALAPGARAVTPGTRGLLLKARPRIKGKARAGKRLTATPGRWSPSPVRVTYRWLRNGKTITGKAGRTRSYRVRRTDRGTRIAVKVTVTRPGYGVRAVRAKAVRVRR